MLEHALAIDFAAVVMQKHARRRLSRTAVANAMVNASTEWSNPEYSIPHRNPDYTFSSTEE